MKFSKLFIIFICATCIFILEGCASIFSKSTYPFHVNTNPSGVNVSIKNSKGVEIFNGTSPATVDLKASEGYFKRANYTVNVFMDGYKPQTLPINFKVDGWYYGNLLLGGLIGMLIVDPASGAMYKIENEYMNIKLAENSTGENKPQFKILDIASIPSIMRKELVELQPMVID